MPVSTIILPVQGAKISGAYVGSTPAIEGGAGAWKLLYDDTIAEEALWQFQMPANYSTTPTIKIPYAMTSATDLDVSFDISIMAVAAGTDIDTTSFDTANNTGALAVPGTAGLVGTTSLVLATVDGMRPLDTILLKIGRSVTVGTVAPGDAELLAPIFEYTTA